MVTINSTQKEMPSLGFRPESIIAFKKCPHSSWDPKWDIFLCVELMFIMVVDYGSILIQESMYEHRWTTVVLLCLMVHQWTRRASPIYLINKMNSIL